MPKLISRKNLSDRKIQTFPQCDKLHLQNNQDTQFSHVFRMDYSFYYKKKYIFTEFFAIFFFSNSSTGEQPIWQIRNPMNQANSTQNQGKEYSRVEGNNQPDTLFSSSASSGGSENGDEATDR